MTDPIADMFTQIRNASLAQKQTVEIPFSKLKFEIGKILEKEGFIRSLEARGRKARKDIEIALRYEQKVPAISDIKRISKPGKRIYSRGNDLRKVKGGMGIAIISTSKGLMTDKEARKQNIGGEILGEVL